MKFLTKQKQSRADNKSGGAQKVMSFYNFLQMPALGVRCLYSHKWNLTPKLCSFGTWHSFLEKSMLNGGTLIQANQGQIKAFKKAMYDYETPTNRFFGSKLVEFNMPYVSRAILWIGPEKSTVPPNFRPVSMYAWKIHYLIHPSFDTNWVWNHLLWLLHLEVQFSNQPKFW